MPGPYVPYEHWPEATRDAIAAAYRAKAAETTGRIRRKAQFPRCACATGPGSLRAERLDDGRCGRCWGWPF